MILIKEYTLEEKKRILSRVLYDGISEMDEPQIEKVWQDYEGTGYEVGLDNKGWY